MTIMVNRLLFLESESWNLNNLILISRAASDADLPNGVVMVLDGI